MIEYVKFASWIGFEFKSDAEIKLKTIKHFLFNSPSIIFSLEEEVENTYFLETLRIINH